MEHFVIQVIQFKISRWRNIQRRREKEERKNESSIDEWIKMNTVNAGTASGAYFIQVENSMQYPKDIASYIAMIDWFFFEIEWNVKKRNVTKRGKSYYSLSLPDFELLFPLIVSIVLLTISLWEALDKLLNIYGILYAINGVTYTLYNRKYIKHKLDKRCR